MHQKIGVLQTSCNTMLQRYHFGERLPLKKIICAVFRLNKGLEPNQKENE